jgi:hypothetical protein
MFACMKNVKKENGVKVLQRRSVLVGGIYSSRRRPPLQSVYDVVAACALVSPAVLIKGSRAM